MVSVCADLFDPMAALDSSSDSPTLSTTNDSFTYPVVKYISQDIGLKLTTENFIFWKAQVLPILRYHNLVGFIDGSLPKPTEPLEDIAKWIRLDQMVLGWLLGALSPKVLSQVVDKPTARAAWSVFEISYGKLSRARNQQLKSELQSIQKGSSSIDDYLHHAKSLALQLAAAKKPVDDDDLLLWLLRGLGSEYDLLVAAINTRVEPPSIDEVSALLLDYELHLTSSTNVTAPTAFNTFGASPSFPGSGSPSHSGQSNPSPMRGGRTSSNRAHGRGQRGRGCSSPSPNGVVCYRYGVG